MTWANRFRLTLGLLAVVALGAYLTFHLNSEKAVAASQSAAIASKTYDVGSQYAGLVVDQLVEKGDPVVEGTPLFVIDSEVLKHEISIGYAPTDTPAAHIDELGRIVVLATGPGTVAKVEVARGTFVPAAALLAQVEKENSLYVHAEYTLTPKEYARIDDGAAVTVVLPNEQHVAGRVAGIEVQTLEGKAQAVVTVESDKLVAGKANGLMAAGTPVTAELQLRNDGVVTDVAAGVDGVVTDVASSVSSFVAGLVE
jgi:multidrug resistance efflux pump